MALSKELLRVCEVNRIMKDYFDFMCDVETDELSTETVALPLRRQNEPIWHEASWVQMLFTMIFSCSFVPNLHFWQVSSTRLD